MYLGKAVVVGHFVSTAADTVFEMLQLYVHSKSPIESTRESKKIMAYVEDQFLLLPESTQPELPAATATKKIKIFRTKQSAWGCFNRVIVAFILDRPHNICLWAYIKAGINVSGGRGPIIESYNASQKFHLGSSANHSFSETIYQVHEIKLLKLCIAYPYEAIIHSYHLIINSSVSFNRRSLIENLHVRYLLKTSIIKGR